MKNRVLVTGAGGYIGSHMCAILSDRGDFVVGLDNLENGYLDAIRANVVVIADVANKSVVANVLDTHDIDTVIHFAGYIQVGESMQDPAKYFENNFSNAASLLSAMHQCGIDQFIFSSTAAVFGNPITTPIDENHPKHPINPYGRSKLFLEEMCADLANARGLKSVSLRYFNAAGARPDGTLGERHEPETHLIPLAIDAALGKRPPLKLFGTDYPTPDGTCVRDYIHIHDLCDAHVAAMDYLRAGHPTACFNLGNGVGFSVLEVIRAVEKAVGRPVPYVVESRRQGDPPSLVGDSTLAREKLEWKPKRANLETIVADAVRWHLRGG